MLTRAQANKNKENSPERDPTDSNLGTSIGSEGSDLIDLNQTFRPITNTITEMASTLSFGEAIKLIPKFSGGSEGVYSQFEKKCDFIMGHVNTDLKPVILEAILAELTDKASEAVRYREISSWEELRKHLRSIFGKTHLVQFLQKQLSQLRQFDKESVQDYANRVEKIYHELTCALTVDKPANGTKIIAQTIQSQALSIFISGIQYAIRIILKANKVTTFEEAVFLALEEEKNEF